MKDQVNGIRLVEADGLGPVVARADHHRRTIEVNRSLFHALSDAEKEYVLCHEVCHLVYADRDEAATNRRAARLYLSRASGDADRAARGRFLARLAGAGGDYSNWWQAVMAAVGLGTSIYGAVKERNAGWYSWSLDTQRSNLDTMLRKAFEESRKTSERSASDIFWETFRGFNNKDGSPQAFLGRRGNEWVRDEVAAFEDEYGFGFDEVTPVDITAFPALVAAAVAAAALLAFLVTRKIIKKVSTK